MLSFFYCNVKQISTLFSIFFKNIAKNAIFLQKSRTNVLKKRTFFLLKRVKSPFEKPPTLKKSMFFQNFPNKLVKNATKMGVFAKHNHFQATLLSTHRLTKPFCLNC